MGILKTSQAIVQNAYVVNNLHASIERWSTALGVGPFYLLENASMNYNYRGSASVLNISVAMVQCGDMNIELIQQLDNTPSAYRDIYKSGEQGFHHVCLFADNFDTQVAHYRQQGFDAALEADMGDYRICYIDSFDALGFMIEIVDDCTAIRSLYNKVRTGSEQWDGADLIRSLY